MDVNYGDDNFQIDPLAYPDQGGTILPQPGVYRLRPTAVGRKKDRKTGQEVAVDGKWPVLVIQRAEIVEPEEEQATYALFHEVPTKPFKRGGSQTPNAAQSIDLLRAIDVNKTGQASNAAEAFEIVEQELQAGEQFRAKIGYKAVDLEAVKSALANVDDSDFAAKRKVWDAHTYRTKAFRNGAGYNTAVRTPDGRTLQAKLVIDAFLRSDEPAKLGPYFKQ